MSAVIKRSIATSGAVATVMLLGGGSAQAVPSFESQTGQPCTACHVGAFGPQLTPFGRAFKIGGYTQNGGEGVAAKIPLSAMLLSSFTNTNSSLPSPASEHYGRNNNVAMDQISVFLAGRVTDWAGGFVQGTFNGITSTFKLDNTDLRPFTTAFDVGATDLRVGLSVNNGPTVQDPYNSTIAWAFPYVGSAFAPHPTAQPLLSGALIGNSLGVTGYAWYDRSVYFEAGGYQTYGPSLLQITGNSYGPGGTTGVAPYVRGAYEWNWNGQSAHVGGLFLYSDFNPTTGVTSVDGSMGRNQYTDFAIDGGYQFLGDGTHVATVYGIYTYETQNLQGTTNAGGSSQPNNNLGQVRVNVSYFYDQTYGVTLGWQKTWGSANPGLFPAQPVSGSVNGKPNSNAFIVEADWIPFGKEDSWAGPWANLKIGAQYIAYTQFNGGTTNYDGYGRNASANNTFYLFAWLTF